ncbi:MAG: hypothetical protein R3F18_02300 [Lysobacterales bacterium]
MGSKAWLSQVDQAFRLFRAADAQGLDLARVAPMLRAGSSNIWRRNSNVRQTSLRRASPLNSRLDIQNLEGAVHSAQFMGFGLDGAPAQCAPALELLAPFRADHQNSAVILRLDRPGLR